jgi:NAD(P)-dependent dehydrogenase (short-subunit alcohol dehydrogenase family)
MDASSLFRLDGKRALITGGYGGIGRVASELFLQAGATVAVAGRSLEKAQALAEEVDGGPPIVPLRIDLADRESVSDCVEEAAERLGGLDILVNLAAVGIYAPAQDLEPGDWQSVMATNLDGTFWLAQAVGRRLLEAGKGGSIVLFSSTRGAFAGRFGFAAYGASKAGVNFLVKQLATEWGPHVINVNGVAPGFVPATEMPSEMANNEQFMAMMRRRVPMGRFGEPHEMAGVALFLASPAASFVNGQMIYVDGAVTASS